MILQVDSLTKIFCIERGFFKRSAGIVKALDNVSFSLNEFDVLGIAGESGSGKTTLAKILLGLIPLSTGQIEFNAQKITNFRKDVQIIFQNPYNSLDPRMRIMDAIIEPLLIHRIVPRKLFRDKTEELLRMVGLQEDALNRYPIEFSGGQRQRICIARALACEPKLLILDEPISSLDLTIQAQMLDLFLELKRKLNLTYIFISHNLAVIKHVANFIIVMKDGRIIERGPSKEIFTAPKDEYTKMLLRAARGE
jgi:peptide/nickel transport system ATP-binding protein